MATPIIKALHCATILLVYLIGFRGKCCSARLSVVIRTASEPSGWSKAFATFYEGSATSFGGACNYKDVEKLGYGENTTALSSALFHDGKTCGACYEIKCARDPEWCKPGSLIVTATDHCPPNPSLPGDNGGWCNHPRQHFDIAKPVFCQLSEYKAGIIPVDYRRVPCERNGGIRFTITGNDWFYQVVVSNVGGAGDIAGLAVKGDDKETEWTDMERDWGSTYKTKVILKKECLSFRVIGSDDRTLTLTNVAPSNWQFGQTYQAGDNFS